MRGNETIAVVAAIMLLLAAPPAPAAGKGDPAGSQGTDEIVVTATRLETPEREVGSSVTVITAEQIRERGKTTVAEVLRGVPSLDVVQSGGVGGTTSVFLRGANSEDTLVLIDGVEMNDPSSPGRGFDFANLAVGGIERIEIVRGPQSTLYGSDAMAGVINIITKKGTGKLSGYMSAEAGAHMTFTEQAGIGGSTEVFNYSVGVFRLDTDGISSAAEKDGNREEDGYKNTTLSTRLGITPTKNFDADLIMRYIDADSDLDNFGGAGGDDPNNTLETKQFFLRTQARLSLFRDLWEQKIGFSFSDQSRKGRNDVDADHPIDLERSSYDGRVIKLDWQNNLYLHESNTLTLGIETEKETANTTYFSDGFFGPFSSDFPKQSARTTGFYLQDQIRLWDSWFTTLGVRVDDHDRFGTKSTVRAASSYLFQRTSTRIKGSYGTGFKAPSLFQLFDPSYGNQELDPEKSTGWDAGVEQTFSRGRLTLGITYFSNNIENMIIWNPSGYVNVGKAEMKGVEAVLSGRPTEDLTLRAGYTYTDAKDKTTGEKLIRRPENKASFGANYRFLAEGNVDLDVLWVGSRDDTDFSTGSTVKLAGYTLVNLAASYNVTGSIKLLGRVENLFDEEYEEVLGYGTPGISVYGGARISF